MNYRDYGALSLMAGLSVIIGLCIPIAFGLLSELNPATDLFAVLMLTTVFLFGVFLTILGGYYYRKSGISLTTRPTSEDYTEYTKQRMSTKTFLIRFIIYTIGVLVLALALALYPNLSITNKVLFIAILVPLYWLAFSAYIFLKTRHQQTRTLTPQTGGKQDFSNHKISLQDMIFYIGYSLFVLLLIYIIVFVFQINIALGPG